MRSVFLAVVVVLFVPVAATADDLPRRMLLVHVGDPLYLNPLATQAPGGPDRVRHTAVRLAVALGVPTHPTRGQLFVLSGQTTSPNDPLPFKSVVAAAMRNFCESSRAQDRLVLIFSGHVVEVDGKAYFVPLEGDPTEPATLVPVADVYEQFGKCKATQKVIIWDVCRRNPEVVAIRPTTVPLSAKLASALAEVPAGIQVVLPCSPAESAIEYTVPRGDAGLYAGSALLESLRKAAEVRLAQHPHTPADAIPIAEIMPVTQKYVASAATAFDTKQTPKLFGGVPVKLVAPDPREAPARRVEFPAFKVVQSADVLAILEELALPSLGQQAKVETLPPLPFDEARLKRYASDVTLEQVRKNPEKYKLRMAVLRALQQLRDTDPRASGNPQPPAEITAPITEAQKKLVLAALDPIAHAIAILELEQDALEDVQHLRPTETNRWQAHYDYTRSQLQLRLAALNEYNYRLAQVRTDSLPMLPAGSRGWQLVPTDTSRSRKDVQLMANQAIMALKYVITANPGTPWEVLAKRALLTPPGLKWEPISR